MERDDIDEWEKKYKWGIHNIFLEHTYERY
jgi:hypothetical protein